MKKNEHENSDLLNHVEPQRRQFLAKLIAGGAVLPVMSSVTLGQPPQDGQGKGGFGGKGNAGFQGKGKGNMAGKGKGGFGASNPDPAELAAKLIREFDKDGDKALNLKELTAALNSVGENRGMGGVGKGKGGFAGKGNGTGKGGFGKGGGTGKGGFGKGKGNAQEGAVKPKRPGSE